MAGFLYDYCICYNIYYEGEQCIVIAMIRIIHMHRDIHIYTSVNPSGGHNHWSWSTCGKLVEIGSAIQAEELMCQNLELQVSGRGCGGLDVVHSQCGESMAMGKMIREQIHSRIYFYGLFLREMKYQGEYLCHFF